MNQKFVFCITFLVLFGLIGIVDADQAVTYTYLFSDNFNDNTFNTTFWQNGTTGSASIAETNQQMELIETANVDTVFFATQNRYRNYNASIEINWTKLNNGNAGIYLQESAPVSGTNAFVNNRVRFAVAALVSTGKISIYYAPASGATMFWNETGGVWSTTNTGFKCSLNTDYNISIERKNIFYRFTLSNATSGTIMNTTWVFIDDLRNDTMTNGDYLIFGDLNNQLGNVDMEFDNFSIKYSNARVDMGDNHTTDRDAYDRLNDDLCYVCNNLTTTTDGFWQFSSFNNTQVASFENSVYLDHASDPDNLTFVSSFFTENGSYRITVGGIPLSTITYSTEQPLKIIGNNSAGNISMTGTYPNYELYINGTAEEGVVISANLSYVLEDDYWYRVNLFYPVTLSTVSGNVTINGSTYEITDGFSSWEHSWGEINMNYDISSDSNTSEYYEVSPLNGYEKGFSFYYRTNETGSIRIYDGIMNINGYEYFDGNYTALSRTVNGSWVQITDWTFSSTSMSSGANFIMNGTLMYGYGIKNSLVDTDTSCRGLYNKTGIYTFPNGTSISIYGDGMGYHQVKVDSLNPTWRWTPCSYGCQNVTLITVENGKVNTTWNAFNSSYPIQNVSINITYPNSTQQNVSAFLINGTNISGIWSYNIGTVEGTYTILTYSNDSRGVWITNTSELIVTGEEPTPTPTPTSAISISPGHYDKLDLPLILYILMISMLYLLIAFRHGVAAVELSLIYLIFVFFFLLFQTVTMSVNYIYLILFLLLFMISIAGITKQGVD